MIIVDTSIWIEFFKTNEPYFSSLRLLLEKREIIALSPIFGELLQGAKTKKEKATILEYWKYLPKITEDELLIMAGQYSFENKFIPKGVGLIDACIVVAAIESSSNIWTLDEKLKRVLKRDFVYK